MLALLKCLTQNQVMWLLILAIYVAPPDAVNWRSSWMLGTTKLMEEPFDTQEKCLTAGVHIKAKLNEGMLAPVRFHCVKLDPGLPAGAPR